MLETTDLLHIAWFLLLVFMVDHAIPSGLLAAGVFDEAVALKLFQIAGDRAFGDPCAGNNFVQFAVTVSSDKTLYHGGLSGVVRS